MYGQSFQGCAGRKRTGFHNLVAFLKMPLFTHTAKPQFSKQNVNKIFIGKPTNKISGGMSHNILLV